MNAGLSVDDEDWVDTRQGQFFQIVTQPFVLEMARGYDEMSTRLAAAFLSFAWGEYLDYHGEQQNSPRKEAVQADGTLTVVGEEDTVVPVGMQVSPATEDPSVTPPVFTVTAPGTISGGNVNVPIEAVVAGTSGNVAAGALTVVVTPTPPGVTSVSNALPTEGGTDVESDDDYKNRLLFSFVGVGPGNINDYKRWGLAWPGVGRVAVQPNWAGPGTVRVVLTTSSGDPVAQAVVDSFQTWIDPVPGASEGQAPPGAIVTVTTSTPVLVAVTATVSFESGYSLDGASGTTALRGAIEDALTEYIDGLDVGEHVIKNHVEAQFFRVTGVHNVALTVPATDVIIDGTLSPPEIATTGTITLDE